MSQSDWIQTFSGLNVAVGWALRVLTVWMFENLLVVIWLLRHLQQ